MSRSKSWCKFKLRGKKVQESKYKDLPYGK